MVAEFVGRGQSGSPVNGEVPQLNSGLPNSREMLSRSNSPNPDHYQMQSSSSSSSTSMNNNKHHKELFSQRKQREFTPDNKKDDNYWDRRRRNNEAAKRSREKRRFNDMVLEQRVVELTKENAILKAQLEAIREEYGVCVENVVCVEKVLANLPTSEQVLSLTKRQKLVHPGAPSSSNGSSLYGPQSPLPIITPSSSSSVIHQTLNNQQQQQIMSHQQHASASSLQQQQQQQQQQSQVPMEPAFREHHHLPSEYHHHSSSSYHHHHQIPPYRHPSPGALNLSARRPKSSPSPFELSSTSGDEGGPPTSSPSTSILIQPSVPQLLLTEPNNSLPLKLRHKSHLGDKDAASALLALHNIKQEPSRASPPYDGEGSSDERDSGISLGAEWTASQAAATLQSLQKSTNNNNSLQETTKSSTQQQHHPYHSEIVRLTTEVEQLKSLMKEKDVHRRH